MFGSEIAKHLAKLTVASDKDKSSPPKNINDFGYGKIQVPEFSGNVWEFTKWRIQVEDYLEQTAKQTTQRQAVNHLDLLISDQIDVSRCATSKDVREKINWYVWISRLYCSPAYERFFWSQAN